VDHAYSDSLEVEAGMPRGILVDGWLARYAGALWRTGVTWDVVAIFIRGELFRPYLCGRIAPIAPLPVRPYARWSIIARGSRLVVGSGERLFARPVGLKLADSTMSH
jgi:hypothetical protein